MKDTVAIVTRHPDVEAHIRAKLEQQKLDLGVFTRFLDGHWLSWQAGSSISGTVTAPILAWKALGRRPSFLGSTDRCTGWAWAFCNALKMASPSDSFQRAGEPRRLPVQACGLVRF